MSQRKAVHFAIIFDSRTDNVLRIFNPTYEYELDHHQLGQHERMLRLKKAQHGIARAENGMTTNDVARLIERYGKRQ